MKKYNEFINEDITKFMTPKSEEDIIKGLDKIPIDEKIEFIIRYQLDFSLLPEGDLMIYGDFNCEGCDIKKLPDNLTIGGSLYFYNNKLTELPKNLTVNGTLDCRYNMLTKLSDSLIIGDSLQCGHNMITKLPDDLTVGWMLRCNDNLLTELPKGLNVGGSIYCSDNEVKITLPDDTQIGGKFYN